MDLFGMCRQLWELNLITFSKPLNIEEFHGGKKKKKQLKKFDLNWYLKYYSVGGDETLDTVGTIPSALEAKQTHTLLC